MAHFARVDDGIVREVLVVSDENAPDPFPEGEAAGAAFLNSIGLAGDWKQTSYNGNFRFHYAGIGYAFDPDFGDHGAFITPQPFPSWTLDEDANWQAPVPYPAEGSYTWDESSQEWVAVEE